MQDHPKEARLYALLARVRAVAGDHKGALEAARTGAELGSANARVMYGVMLAEGQHVARDYAAAREQFRRAAGGQALRALQPRRDARQRLGHGGRRARRGRVVPPGGAGRRSARDAGARPALRQGAGRALAARGRADAPRGRARAASHFQPAARYAASFEWYIAKARGGEAWAQAYVGALAESGQWVQQDDAIALAWYRAAGTAGNVPAQWRVARFYNEGAAAWRRTRPRRGAGARCTK